MQIDHAVTDVLVVDESGSKFLLVQEGKPGRAGLYNLPGGHVDSRETLFAAAVREVREETGYIVELTGLVGIYQGIYRHINVSGPVFSARVTGGSATPSQEHPEVRWVTRKELDQLVTDGKLFTQYPPLAVAHYLSRGAFPIDLVTCVTISSD